MFKISARLDQIEPLYTARNAPESLRTYDGATGLLSGRDGPFIVSPIGYRDMGPDERPRVIECYTLASQPWMALTVPEYLMRHAGPALARILESGSRADLRTEIDQVREACAELEKLLVAPAPDAATSPRRERAPMLAQAFGGGLVLVVLATLAWPSIQRRISPTPHPEVKHAIAAIEARLNEFESGLKRVASDLGDHAHPELERRIGDLEIAMRSPKPASTVPAETRIPIDRDLSGLIPVPLPPIETRTFLLRWTSQRAGFDLKRLRIQAGDKSSSDSVDTRTTDTPGELIVEIPRRLRSTVQRYLLVPVETADGASDWELVVSCAAQ